MNNNLKSNVANIYDLPLELQFRIISNFDLRTHLRFRKISTGYQQLSNLYWQTELNELIAKLENAIITDPDVAGMDLAILQSLQIATAVYNANVAETKFWNILLKCLLRNDQCTLAHLTGQLHQEFLLKFYKSMDHFYYVHEEFPQYLRSLYVMQVLHILKCLPFTELCVRNKRISQHIHIAIDDVWLGVTFGIMSSIKHDFIPVALAQLLYAYRSNRTAAFANLHQGHCYTYGYNAELPRRHFRTQFHFLIEGTQELRTYIQNWLLSTNDSSFFPRRIFIEYFRCRIKIEVLGRVKYSWPQKILIELE